MTTWLGCVISLPPNFPFRKRLQLLRLEAIGDCGHGNPFVVRGEKCASIRSEDRLPTDDATRIGRLSDLYEVGFERIVGIGDIGLALEGSMPSSSL